MNSLHPGAAARVSVPATSANLGPGFDTLALAYDIRDEYEAVVTDGLAVTVETTGEGADCLPTDESHLVAKSLRAALLAAGHDPGFRLTCRNAIPQGKGLGSSAAAIVGGLALAGQLVGHSDAGEIVRRAAEIEGHPDNVAAATLGGLTVSWHETTGARATGLPVHPDVALVLFVPAETSPTPAARAALPDTIAHADAAFNAGRAALLVAALTRDPELLFPATEDRLHQWHRRETYPRAMELVGELRQQGWAAVVSGAGPAVLVLTTADRADDVAPARFEGFDVHRVAVAPGATATRMPDRHS